MTETAMQPSKRLSADVMPSFTSLLNAVPIALMLCDRELRCVGVNQAFAAVTGLPVDAHRGRRLPHLWSSLAEAALPSILSAMETGEAVVGLEFSAAVEGGARDVRWWQASCHPTFDSPALVSGVSIVVVDVTEQHRGFEAQQHLTAIIESTSDAIYTADLDDRVLTWNAGAERLYGFTASEILGCPVAMLTPHNVQPTRASLSRQVLDGSRVDTFKTVRMANDGRRITVAVTVSPLRGPQEQIVGTLTQDRAATDHERAENALRRSEELHQGLVEDQPDLVTRMLPDGTLTFVNRACAAYYGAEPASLVGGNVFAMLPSDEAETLRQALDGLSPETPASTTVQTVRSSDGAVCQQERTNRGLFDDDRRLVEIQGIGRDITAQVQAEAALQVSEERFRIVAGIISDAVWDWDLVTDTLWWSDAVKTMFGLEPAALSATSESWIDHIHPDDRERVRAGLRAVLDGAGAHWSDEYRFRRADGTHANVLDRGQVFRDEDGRPIRAVGGMVDITDRIRAETALREREAMLASILAASPDLISVIGRDGASITVSPAMEEVLGFPADDRVGHGLTERIHPDDAERVVAALTRALSAGGVERIRHRYQHRDGHWLILESWGRAVPEVDGVPRYVVAVSRDVTEAVQAEKRLALANAELSAALDRAQQAVTEAERANRAKSEFLATMSHEIRTPLNGVIGMTSLLLDSALTPEARDSAETIRASGEALLTIINDILDFSKIDAGRMELEVGPCDPSAIAEEVVGLLSSQAAAKGVTLSTLADIPNIARFKGDTGRIRQVLLNLVGNAVKFTRQGGVTIDAYLVDYGDESDGALVRYDVRDTGDGIPADTMARLFQPFVQADSSTTRRYGGTGLGLAISKRLTELLGGEIGVESTVGQGSTFWFTVRLQHDRAAETTHLPDRVLRGRRVLLVSDDATSRQTLRQQLNLWGVAVTTVSGEDAALATLSLDRWPPTMFDAVILDLHGGSNEGQRAARAIRDDPQFDGMALVALTSQGDAASGSAVRAADAHLARPVRPSLLHALLADLLLGDVAPKHLPPAPATQPAGAMLPPRAHGRILVAEDNVVNQKVAARMLQKLGHQVDVVANGLEAVDAIRRLPYAAVLMDCQMPEMDGYEATSSIRALEGSGRRTPIIAMTASAMQGDREACLKAGMDDYVSKPVRQEDLAYALARWMPASSDAPTVVEG